MIPKVIHQIWIGGPMPANYRQWHERWRRLNPEWIVRLWGEEAAELLPDELRPLYSQATSHAQRSDFLRLAVLREYGGWYLDSDFEPLREIGTLLDNCEAAVFRSNDADRICNGSLAAAAGHPLIAEYLRRIPEAFRCGYGNSIGPPLITEIMRANTFAHVRRIDRRVMFPITWETRDKPSVLDPQTIAMHHFAGSWLKK